MSGQSPSDPEQTWSSPHRPDDRSPQANPQPNPQPNPQTYPQYPQSYPQQPQNHPYARYPEAQPQQPYGQQYPPPQPYGSQLTFGPNPPPRQDYASWGRRVGAALIDYAPGLIGSILVSIGLISWYAELLPEIARGGAPTNLNPFSPVVIVGFALSVVALLIDIWNRWLVAGRTGQSLGKRVMKIWLIDERTGRPIGPLMAFARDLVHRIDGVFYVGYLWPLWDERRQTFSDKLLKTAVVTTPVDPSLIAARR